jgi:hypothetical protein
LEINILTILGSSPSAYSRESWMFDNQLSISFSQIKIIVEMKLTISFSASMGITVLPFNNYGKEIFNLGKKKSTTLNSPSHMKVL